MSTPFTRIGPPLPSPVGSDMVTVPVAALGCARQLKVVRKIKTLVALAPLLRYATRVAVVTSLLSAIFLILTLPDERVPFDWNPAGIVWLLFSTAFFYPCAVLVDIALLGFIVAARIPPPTPDLWGSTHIFTAPLFVLCAFVQWITMLLIGLLRLLGLGLALLETYYLGPDPPDASLMQSYFDLLVRGRYDWWALKPLPRDFLSRARYKRLCRPWLPPTLEPSSRATHPSTHDQATVTPYLSIFFGTWTFRSRRGERKWFVAARGIVAIGVLATLTGFSINVLALQPSDERGSTPIQIKRVLPRNLSWGNSPHPTWGVVIGVNVRWVVLPADLSTLVSVAAEAQVGSGALPSCVLTRIPVMLSGGSYNLAYFECPDIWIVGEGKYQTYYRPQIHISVDYAALGIFRSNFTPESSLMIWPAFTSNVRKVLDFTSPVKLMFGTRLIASVETCIRTSFITPTWATFGFPSEQDVYMTGHITILGSDPFKTGADEGRPDGFASMRLVYPSETAEAYEVYSETRQHSVLWGISALGGLLTFLNSVFMIFFGGSIMLVLFDVKPLSTFGLLHKFSKATLFQQIREDFPRIYDEGGQPGEPGSGLVTFIREYFMDFAALPLERTDQGLDNQQIETTSGSMTQIDGGRNTVDRSHSIGPTQ